MPVGDSKVEPSPRPYELRGRPASPGIGIGPAYIVERRQVQVRHVQVAPEHVAAEIERFRAALRATSEQLDAIKAKMPHGEHVSLLAAQQLMLSDPDLIAQTERLIADEKINAEWAIVKTTDEIRRVLDAAADDYLRERQVDVAFLSERLLRTLLNEVGHEIAPPVGVVVVAHALRPAHTAQLNRTNAAGILTDVGGPTSHSAIMARALGIPAVVGVDCPDDLLKLVEPGDLIIVDGTRGRIHIRPPKAVVTRYELEAERYRAFESCFANEHALPAVTQDGRRLHLRANLALEEELDAVVLHGAEGVGLYRTEYMYMHRDVPPTEEEHYRVAKKVLQRCSPNPVTFRTFDLGSDKPCRFMQADEKEANPAMGLRSLRLSLRYRDIFLSQLKGLLRAALHGPLRIMLPLISGMGELRDALSLIESAKAELTDAGLPYSSDVEVGIMIEVPAAVMIADILARHVDFMSIGTNDLIQYTLAIDRENDEVGYLYEPLHPAILRMIRQVVEAGKAAQIPVSVCGEMASDMQLAWMLLGLGVDELSVHPIAVPVLKHMIRQSQLGDMKQFADQVLAGESIEEAKRLLQLEMQRRFPDMLAYAGG